jgi:hypothetical protein
MPPKNKIPTNWDEFLWTFDILGPCTNGIIISFSYFPNIYSIFKFEKEELSSWSLKKPISINKSLLSPKKIAETANANDSSFS